MFVVDIFDHYCVCPLSSLKGQLKFTVGKSMRDPISPLVDHSRWVGSLGIA